MNESIAKSDLTPAQHAAIRAAEELSEKIAREHPEIVDLYKGGINQAVITTVYGFDKEAKTEKIAHMAVHYAIKSLLPDDEREKITTSIREKMGNELVNQGKGIHGLTDEERQATGKKVHREKKGVHALNHEDHKKHGERARDMGVGIHALTPGQRREQARRHKEAGIGVPGMSTEEKIKLGKRLHEMGAGIHGMTKERRTQIAADNVRNKRGIHGMTREERAEAYRLSVIARGNTPRTGEELKACREALIDPQYRYIYRGRICIALTAIAEELNRKFHDGKNARGKHSIDFVRHPRKSRQKTDKQ